MPTTELTRQIAGVLRAELGRSQHTQEWLATRIGLSQSQLSKVLRGLRPMDLEQLETACALFGRTMFDVVAEAQARLGGEGTPHPTKSLAHMPADPRSLLLHLLDNPDKDTELLARLGAAAEHVGTKSLRAKRLADEIRHTRHAELNRALQSLPPQTERAAGNQ